MNPPFISSLTTHSCRRVAAKVLKIIMAVDSSQKSNLVLFCDLNYLFLSLKTTKKVLLPKKEKKEKKNNLAFVLEVFVAQDQ